MRPTESGRSQAGEYFSVLWRSSTFFVDNFVGKPCEARAGGAKSSS
jgi:hypothetical protein